jgi:hypothetical protein
VTEEGRAADDGGDPRADAVLLADQVREEREIIHGRHFPAIPFLASHT